MDQNSSHFHPQQEEAKFIESAESGFDTGASIPELYGDNRLVLMARDPLWFFTYWEISNDRYTEVHRQFGQGIWEQSAQVLRVYDETDAGQGNGHPRFFDVDVQFDTRNWYIHVPQPGHSYRAELGLRLKDGRFIVFLGSNRITLPFGRVSELTDAEWVSVDYSFEEWIRLMRVHALGSSGVLPEAAKEMALRWEFLRSVFSGSSMLSGSRSFMAPLEDKLHG